MLKFLKSDIGAGTLLVVAALIAMALANSPLAELYTGTLDTRIRIGLDGFGLEKTVHLWINDALMAVFFFLVDWVVSNAVKLVLGAGG